MDWCCRGRVGADAARRCCESCPLHRQPIRKLVHELQAVPARRGHQGPRRDLQGRRRLGEEPSRARRTTTSTSRPSSSTRWPPPSFRRYLGEGGLKILESGCGTGRWMAYFEKLGNRAYGVDDSWGPLRLAREHDPDMRLVRSNALAHPVRRQHLRRGALLLRRRALRGGSRGAVPRDPPRAQAGRPAFRRRAVQQHLPPATS